MNEQQVLEEFKQAGAILSGHFLLTSGLHTNTYMQCARVLMDATRADRLCFALAEKVKEGLSTDIDLIVAPAMGGVVVGYEMGRQLGLTSIFCERVDGEFTVRRGFEIPEGANVLVVEDVVTTGKSSLEAFECVKSYCANVIAEACLVNRSGKSDPIGDTPLFSLITLDIKTYAENDLPEELAAIPAVKPGSRGLK